VPVREPPEDVDEQALRDLVRGEWDARVDALEHLPVGFGAHHWAASAQGHRLLFVTFDRLGSKRDADELESAYRAAAALAGQGLEFVLPCLPAACGDFTLPLAGGAVSVTPWTGGRSGSGRFVDAAEAVECAAMVRRLHAAEVPAGIPEWRPLVTPELPDALARALQGTWDTGPLGEQARTALLRRLPDVWRWTASYSALADLARTQRERWVPTHGEPDTGNQLVSDAQRYLVDWESLKLAPPERDLRTWSVAGHAAAIQHAAVAWPMVEMFDLEWRLDEIAQYAAWFAAPHAGTADDRIALGGLLGELDRPDWRPPG
jgi:spectinomycin phosphotransferase